MLFSFLYLRFRFHLLAGIMLFLVFPASGRSETVSTGTDRVHPACADPVAAGRFIAQQDSSDIVEILVYRDSIKNEEGKYLRVRALVAENRIISVFVDGQEIDPEDYPHYVHPLNEILRQKEELENRLRILQEKIRSHQKELDSLEVALLRVDSLSFFPGEDLYEQVVAAITVDPDVGTPGEDTLSQIPSPPDQEKISKLLDEVMQLKTQRDEIAGQIKEDLSRMEEDRSAVINELENLKTVLIPEKECPGSGAEPKQKINDKSRKGKKRKRKKER